MSWWAAAEQNARKDVFHQIFPSHFITLSPNNDIRAAGKPRWDHYRCEADNEKKISRFQAEHERNEINKSEISLIRILKDKERFGEFKSRCEKKVQDVWGPKKFSR